MQRIGEQFRKRVEAFLEATGVKPTEFGRQAVGDPNFVLGLRRGRSPTLSTADKVLEFIARAEAAAQQKADRKRP